MQRKVRLYPWVAMAMIVSLLSGAGILFAANGGLNTRSDLLAVDFTNDRLGWVVGTRGGIFKTEDGGLHWRQQKIDTMRDVLSVSFYNDLIGWVVGQDGLIYRTSDGGKTWERQISPKTKQLLDVCAVTAEKCWAVGDWGVMVYTDDGGDTWQDRTYKEDIIFNQVVFVSEMEGWIAGEIGIVLHTIDGGDTWSPIDEISQDTLFSISFSSDQEGIAVGLGGIILRTEDGGTTWERTDEGADTARSYSYGRGDASKAIYSVNMWNNNVVLAGDAGTVMYSNDIGRTWSKVELPSVARLIWLRGTCLSSDKRAYIVGARSMIFILEQGNLTAWGHLGAVQKIDPADKMASNK